MSDSPLTEWALGQIKAHGAEPLLGIGLACVGIAFGAGWVVAFLKTKVQIREIREKARKGSGDNIEKLAQKRANANSKSQDLDMARRNMIEALRENKAGVDNVAKLRSCREELCNVYQNDYLPAANDYVELIPCLVDKKEARIRAETELLPGLNTVCVFLEMVNMAEMLSKIPNSQLYKLNKARRDGLLLRVKKLVPWWCVKLRWKLKKVRKRTDPHLRA